MNKKIIGGGGILVIIIAMIGGWNYWQDSKKMALSNLALANIEALASGEAEEVTCNSGNELNCKIIVKDCWGNVTGEFNVKGENKY